MVDRQTVSSLMEAFQNYLPKNTSIAISDAEEFVYYKPSKTVDLKIEAGDQIKEGSLTAKAIITKKRITEFIDESVYGIPYFGVSVPIFEEDTAVGAVTTILPAKPSPISTHFITIKADDLWYPVVYEDVMYLEAESRKTKVKTKRVEGHHKLNLSELEIILPQTTFVRVHRSYIVNLTYVKEIHPDSHSTFLLIMQDNTKVPVSQTYSSLFRKALNF